jgi:hypothetical protein
MRAELWSEDEGGLAELIDDIRAPPFSPKRNDCRAELLTDFRHS